MNTIIKNIENSISNDIEELHNLQNELKNTRKQRKETEAELDNQYMKTLSGIIDSLKNTIKRLKRKIINLGKKAFNLISNIETKTKLKNDLKSVIDDLNNEIFSDNIINTLDEIQKDFNDANKLRKYFTSISKRTRENSKNLFGNAIKTMKDEYPDVYNLYEKIHKKLRRFKKDNGPLTYGKNKQLHGNILAEEYQKEKYDYEQGANKHQNFQDFMTFKEWLQKRSNKDKYESYTDNDIEKLNKIYNENIDNHENENIINLNNFNYAFDVYESTNEVNIETTEKSNIIDDTKRKVEESYNSINEKNKKIQEDEDC